jgi:hypothetical protein
MGARPRQGICLLLNRHRQFQYLQGPRSRVARPGRSPNSLHCLNRISTNSLQGLVAVRSEIGPCLRLEESLGLLKALLARAAHDFDRPYRQARRIALAISGKLNDQLGDRGRRRIVTIRDVQICKGRLEPGGEYGDILRPKRNVASRKRVDHFGHRHHLYGRDQVGDGATPAAMIVVNYDKGFAKISQRRAFRDRPVAPSLKPAPAGRAPTHAARGQATRAPFAIGGRSSRSFDGAGT